MNRLDFSGKVTLHITFNCTHCEDSVALSFPVCKYIVRYFESRAKISFLGFSTAYLKVSILMSRKRGELWFLYIIIVKL